MYRFTIRDILWLTVVVGMGLGWCVDHVRQEARVRQEKANNIDAAVKVQIEWLKRYRGEASPSDESAK